MWLDIEITDLNNIPWRVIVATDKLSYIQVSKDECRVMVDKLGEFQFKTSEECATCYNGFKMALNGSIAMMPGIGHIKPIVLS